MHMNGPAQTAAERYIQLVNARDLDALVELFATDAVVDAPTGSTAATSRSARSMEIWSSLRARRSKPARS
jgi:hypothetical protein